MSVRAVGWLQSKLGLDIGGRSSGDGDSGNLGGGELAGFATAQNRSYSTDPVATVNGDSVPSLGGGEQAGGGAGTFSGLASGWESKLGQVWKQASDKATQYWSTSMRGIARNDPFGLGPAGSQDGIKGNGATDDNPELDENGLPVTRNWYYYDAQLGRWTVSRDAPDSVQREYYEKLEEAERERMGPKKVLPPPRPVIARGPPPLLGAAGRGHCGSSPQYAVPDYFGTASAIPAAPQQEAQAYGGAASQHAQSAASVGPPLPPTMSTHPGAYYSSNPPTAFATTSATMQTAPSGQSLSAHSQATSLLPPPPQPHVPAVSAISAPTCPTVGSAYAAAFASPPSSLHAPSFAPPSDMAAWEATETAKAASPPPRPTQASPASSNPPSQPHFYDLSGHNGMPPFPAALASPAPKHHPSVAGSNSVDVPSPSSAHASASAPASYASAARGAYPYGRSSASDDVSVQDSATAIVSSRAATAPQTSFGMNSAVQWQQSQMPASNPYAFPAPATVTAQTFAAAPAAQVQHQLSMAEANGYGTYPSASSLETFPATGTAATGPSAIGLPPPPSFKPFSPS
ncbi:hypothetical protein CUR178_03583 [Leishmania enriettii]|uniref:Uncharacterized protein n=1 Tax=Leishmania enriettii TaxID=5663 RepID=A0A836HFF4_LEIEN|nr:hypothetical protein CUR178_03583 [Leishmania enriettii]